MVSREFEVPKGVTVKLDHDHVTVEGSGKSLKKKIDPRSVTVSVEGQKVVVKSVDERKKNTQTVGTTESIIKNLIHGLSHEFVYKLKSEHKHFPLKITVQGTKVEIGNYLGEKSNKYAKIVPGAKVEVKGQDIIVKSNDKNAAGQTAANIENASKQSRLCDRKFMDGVYIIEKP